LPPGQVAAPPSGRPTRVETTLTECEDCPIWWGVRPHPTRNL
jgi:hypothetical protein